MKGMVGPSRRLLAPLLGLAVAALASGPAALAAAPESAIGATALEYARGLDDFLIQMPEEAGRLGVDLATLPELRVSSIHQVYVLDGRFADPDDERDIDAARVNASDLWWVVLQDAKGKARLQVSVRWTAGEDAPRAVGMNWMDADDLQTAFKRIGDPNATLIWVPEDLSLFVAGPASSRKVVPVAGPEELERVSGVSGEAIAMRDYSRGLHDRLKALVRLPAEEGAGGAGVGAAPVAAPGLPVGLLAAAAFLTCVGVLVVGDRRRAR